MKNPNTSQAVPGKGAVFSACGERISAFPDEPVEEPNPAGRFKITVPKARRILGMIGKNYSDEDLAEVIACLRSIAEYGFERYHKSGGDAPRSACQAVEDGKSR